MWKRFCGRYWAPCVGGCCSDRIFGYTLCFLRTCHECDINELLAYPTGAVTVHRKQRVKESEGEGEKVIEWVAQLKHKVVAIIFPWIQLLHTHTLRMFIIKLLFRQHAKLRAHLEVMKGRPRRVPPNSGTTLVINENWRTGLKNYYMHKMNWPFSTWLFGQVWFGCLFLCASGYWRSP